jgi:hypothetical protein
MDTALFQVLREVQPLAFIIALYTRELCCYMFICCFLSLHAIDIGLLGNCVDWLLVALLNLLSKLSIAFLKEEIEANKNILVYLKYKKAFIDSCGLSAYTL